MSLSQGRSQGLSQGLPRKDPAASAGQSPSAQSPSAGELDGLQITWKDGLPKDRAEESVIESTLIAAELTSHYSSIKRLLDGDDDAAQEEMDRIKQEQMDSAFNPALLAAQAPPPGGPSSTASGSQQQNPTDNLSQSALLLAQLRGGQGGGAPTPEEGGTKK